MDTLLLIVLAYLGAGVTFSFFVKTKEKIDSGWPVAVLFLGALLHLVILVLGWPKAVADEYF